MMVQARNITIPCWRAALQLILALAVFATPLSGSAADDAQPMRFDRISLDDGLSQSSVVSILQDNKGYMWFGTENGLNRFNGYEFDHFRQQRGNPQALRNDFIYDVAESSDGSLWIATKGGGLSRLDPRTGAFDTFQHDANNADSIAGNIVRKLLIDDTGGLWIGLRDGGLDHLDPATGKFTHHALGDTQSASVFALHLDGKDTLWVGTDEGLFAKHLDSGDTTAYLHDANDESSLSSNRVRAITTDHTGALWVGTFDGGLNRLDPSLDGFVRFSHKADDASSISDDRVRVLFEDRDRRLWVGTSRGLNLFDRPNERFVRYQNDASDSASLSSDAIASIYQDRSGLLWVGTLTAGVNTWNPDTWALGLRESKSLAINDDARPNVTAFASDADTLWIGTFGDGLIAENRDSGEQEHFRHEPSDPASLSDSRVMSLGLDREGEVWAGTMRGGLNRLDPKTGKITVYRNHPENPESISANGIMAVFIDSQGLVWAGTFGGGISVFDKRENRFSRPAADALSDARITSFTEDRRGNIWVGTDSRGLMLLDRKTGELHTFSYDADDASSLSADTVYSLYTDVQGTVWVGTRGGGLDQVVGTSAKPQDVRFRNLSQQDGLSNDVVYGIQSSGDNELWLSTNYGITRYNAETGDIEILHRRDGLQSEEFNFGAHHASFDGTLYFGGLAGYNEFAPEALPENGVAPAVVLTGFFGGDGERAGLPEDLDEGLELDYKDNSISFEFAALDFISPQNNRYMYKLEGFDKDWIDVGNHRRITYTDLDDGYYLLRVKAANSDGVWNETGVALPISVAAAPWDTWWAYLAYTAIFVQLCLFLWWGHQRKMRREAEYSERLEREVRQRTRELAARSEELVELNQSLQESSLSDPLTGLRNRRFVFEEISRDLETIGRKHDNDRRGKDAADAADLVFMMIDLDNFKPINDTYGHAAGDQMLLEIRDVLLSTCRKSDFVVRWGGDEFVVVAKQSHAGESEALAERIRSRIAATQFELADGQIVRTTCSIGFVAYPLYKGHSDNAGLDEVIHLADSLMYEAKRQRDAWVGLLGIDEAATSEGFATDRIEPSSILFRARRNGKLIEHDSGSPLQHAAGGAA